MNINTNNEQLENLFKSTWIDYLKSIKKYKKVNDNDTLTRNYLYAQSQTISDFLDKLSELLGINTCNELIGSLEI